MPLPKAVARFNKRYTNRFIEPVVRHNAGFAVVHHLGRRSGGSFATPVNVFRDRTSADPHPVLVALTYGPAADWVRNVQSGPADIDFGDGARRPIEQIQIVGRDRAWSLLPRPVRLVLRVLQVRDFAEITVGPI